MSEFGSSRDAGAKSTASEDRLGASSTVQWEQNDYASTVGRIDGVVVVRDSAAETLTFTAGAMQIQDMTTGQMTRVDVAEQVISPPDRDGFDHVYQAVIDEDGLVQLSEIDTNTDTSYPTSLREFGFLGVAFYNGSLDTWTVFASMSVEAQRPGSTSYAIGYVVAAEAFLFAVPLVTAAAAGGKRLAHGAGAIFALGSNRQLDPTRPHTHVVVAADPADSLQNRWRDAPDSWLFFQGPDGDMVIDDGTTPLWTKLDDNTGVLKTIADDEWAIMPIFMGALNILGTSPDGIAPSAVPFIYMSQVAVKDGAFQKNPYGAVVAALAGYTIDALRFSNFALIGAVCMRGDATATDDADKVRIYSGTLERLIPTSPGSDYLSGSNVSCFDPLNYVPIPSTVISTLVSGTRHLIQAAGGSYGLCPAFEGASIEVVLGVDASGSPVTITPAAGDTIEGGASTSLDEDVGAAYQFIAEDDTNWILLHNFTGAATLTTDVSTTSATYVDIFTFVVEMPYDGRVDIVASVTLSNTVANRKNNIRVTLDGVAVESAAIHTSGVGVQASATLSPCSPAAKGTRTFAIQWKTNGGTLQCRAATVPDDEHASICGTVSRG